MDYKFTIPLRPFGKQSVRVFRNHAFLPKETREYMAQVTNHFCSLFPGYKPIQGAVKMTTTAFFAIPKHLSMGKYPKIESGAFNWPLKKPDTSNILKIVEDGLNGYAFADDAHIVESHIYKRWGSPARVEVEIIEL